ncbi:MAG: DUF6445 family protein [Parvibaculales bacterium]
MSSQPCQVQNVGNSKTPVLVFDDFHENCAEIADYAVNKADFTNAPSDAFPGYKAALPQDLTLDMLRAVLPDIYTHYAVPRDLRINVISAFFGLVSDPDDTLDATQSRPHYDHALPCSFAILHYVNPGQFGGTGFFRHMPSGFELITGDNQKDYHRSVDGFLSEHGLPQGYDMTQQDHYKLLDAVDYHTNRLLIYPSGLLHSGLINPPEDLSPDPALGRLTSSIFINFYAPDAAAS